MALGRFWILEFGRVFGWKDLEKGGGVKNASPPGKKRFVFEIQRRSVDNTMETSK